ncbi:MAG: OST-HTH/LOTUS domain-containing protein [Proteobacteria bacterium]|nr:OST-HTH/LOTUS domain-containing protein [Pseudomonadota bacterium]
MKALVAHHMIDGPADALKSIQAERIANVAGKTLGNLVGQLLGSYLVSEEADTSDEITARTASDTVSFGMRMKLLMPADDYARIESGLKELVQLRNSLVHHFMDQHDLWSLEGCQGAHDALLAACSRIDQHFEQLRGWAVQMDQVRKLMAEFVLSNAGYDLIVNGIAPDGTVHWPAAGIVHELRNAARELAVDGWTPVAVAGHWIADRDPEQQPAKYGCSSWRQVVHESRQFELRYRDIDDQRAAYYRPKDEQRST